MAPVQTRIGVATEKCSASPARVDATALGGRGRLVIMASAHSDDSRRARGTLRASAEHLEWSLRALLDEDPRPPDLVVEHFEAAVRRLRQGAAQLQPALLLAFIGSKHTVVCASPGIRCYRFRAEELVDVTAAPEGDHPPGGLAHTVVDTLDEDAYVFCTQGLFGALSESQILEVLTSHYHPRDVAWLLVKAARQDECAADVSTVVIRPS